MDRNASSNEVAFRRIGQRKPQFVNQSSGSAPHQHVAQGRGAYGAYMQIKNEVGASSASARTVVDKQKASTVSAGPRLTDSCRPRDLFKESFFYAKHGEIDDHFIAACEIRLATINRRNPPELVTIGLQHRF
jgi:hypothetical protein